MDWSRAQHVPQKREPAAPPQRIATLFRVVGPSGRPLRCAVFSVSTGVELRLGYEDDVDAVLQTHLFREGQDEAIAEMAATWRGKFDAIGGFKDLAILD